MLAQRWPNVAKILKICIFVLCWANVGPTLTIWFCWIEKIAMEALIAHQQDKSLVFMISSSTRKCWTGWGIYSVYTYPWAQSLGQEDFAQYFNRQYHILWAASRENRLFANAKTKTQISFAVTTKLISAFVFAIWIVQSLYYLNPKFQASSYLLWLHSPVCVRPGRKPRRPVSSQRGSYRLWQYC